MAKIVHIIQGLAVGGGGTVALTYFHRYQVAFETLAVTPDVPFFVDRLREQGLKVYNGYPPLNPRPCLFYAPFLAWILWREKTDVVMLHGQWSGLGGSIAAWLARVPKIIYVTHLPTFYCDVSLIAAIRHRITEKITCMLSWRVIALTRATQNQYLLRRLGDEEKIVHIPNGVNPKALMPVADKMALRRELGLPDSGPLAVCVGRLEGGQKPVDWLLRAWQKVEAIHPNAHLVIIGDGPSRSHFEGLTRTLDLNTIHFLGQKHNGSRYFAAADVAVVASRFEGGNPLSMLEAMACACPVVATAADGIWESIQTGHNGICVPMNDPQALAEGVLQVFADPDRAVEMGRAGRRYVEKYHDIEVSIQRQIQLAVDGLTSQ